MLVDAEGAIWFRQSWLDTANRCAERGRLAITKPEWSEPSNDAAVIGTGTHDAIRAVLCGEITPSAVGQYAYASTLRFCAENGVRWVQWTLPGQLADHAKRCAEAWSHEIRPSVALGGPVELEFKVPLFEWKGRQVGVTGTVDYVDPNGVIYDWKTASRKFDQRIKQRTAIQPTVYATAAVHGGLGKVREYPVTFRYGVMVRGNDKATTQLIDTRRTHAHEGWLLDQLNSYLDLAEGLGVERRWPRDEDHFLCNEKWCPWWAACKGARLSASQDQWSG